MPPFGYTCSKFFEGYPCCHRQWQHSGHCRFVHGYSRSFTFWFAARKLDEFGFVVDFSGLKVLEQKLRAIAEREASVKAEAYEMLEIVTGVIGELSLD